MPSRRRLYLMRHGSVDYFRADGSPVPPHGVALNADGRAQADAAGTLFARSGVRFDRVVVSGLPRTVETAARVLAAAGQSIACEAQPALAEIRGGRLADLAPDEVEAAFLAAFQGGGSDVEARRFLGGETVGALLDRALPAFERLLREPGWRTLLLVLHGGVNRALLARALTGTRAFFGALEQSPGCINVLDVPLDGTGPMVVHAIGLAPLAWLHEGEHETTMEKLLAQYRRRTAESPP